jgi:hypothetical protein
MQLKVLPVSMVLMARLVVITSPIRQDELADKTAEKQVETRFYLVFLISIR